MVFDYIIVVEKWVFNSQIYCTILCPQFLTRTVVDTTGMYVLSDRMEERWYSITKLLKVLKFPHTVKATYRNWKGFPTLKF